jgi:ATP-binding cassette, subfamily B, multidrug efflux pump
VSATKGSNGARARDKLKEFHEEQELGQTYDARLLARMWPFLRPHRLYLAISLLTLLLVAGGNLTRPLLMGRVVRAAGASGSFDAVVRAGAMLSLVVLLQQFLSFAQMYAMQIAGARAMADLRAHIFAFLQRMRLSYFDRTPVGRLVTRVTSDVDAVGELFASGVLNALGDLVQLAGIVALMLALDWQLSLIAFAALPFVGLLVNSMRSRSRTAFREIRSKTARLNAFLNEQVLGVAVVQAYAKEEAVAQEFDEINAEYRDANKRSIFYEAVLDAAIEMVSTLCIASLLWWVSGNRLAQRGITFETLVIFTQYIKQFFEPVSLLAQRYTLLQSAMAGAERIFQLIDQGQAELEPETTGAVALPEPKTAESALAFDGVTFGYRAEHPVLHDVSFRVRPFEKVAVVGATGAGKSTLTSLLLRLYEVQVGTVSVLGQDVTKVDRGALRRAFAVVPQDVLLFAGTVLSNVAIGDSEPSLLRARQALERVGALELFEGREGGLNAVVDERGANFSAGERQLLSFARALYRDAPIVILDEATASIDSDTERRLQVAVEAVMADRAALIIAHRLSTIRTVDRILVFHKGRLVEEGPHDALLAKGGLYARLYRLQFAGSDPEGPSAPPVSPDTPANSLA